MTRTAFVLDLRVDEHTQPMVERRQVGGTCIVSKDAPKSAVELVMERLKQQDAAGDVGATVLTADQKEAIAAARRDYEAAAAEAEILFRSKLAATFDPEARQELEANHRRDLRQSASTRDRKIAAIREVDPGSPRRVTESD